MCVKTRAGYLYIFVIDICLKHIFFIYLCVLVLVYIYNFWHLDKQLTTL